MVTVLILTHGGLGRELLDGAETIAAHSLEGFEALCLSWGDGLEEIREQVRGAIVRLDVGDGVLILTDMYGGTPWRIASGFQEAGKVEVVSGANLPMVVRLACRIGGECERMSVSQLAGWLTQKGRESVRRADPVPAAASGSGR